MAKKINIKNREKQTNPILDILTKIGLKFDKNTLNIGEIFTKIYGIIKYPNKVKSEWLSKITNILNTVVTIGIKPVDSTNLINAISRNIMYDRSLAESSKDPFSNDSQKELLKKEIIEMNNFALSGDIVERQFYISLWDKYQEGIEKEIYRKAMLLVEKFTINNIGCEILNQREIMRFINLINNPYYAHLEDTDYEKNIPIITE